MINREPQIQKIIKFIYIILDAVLIFVSYFLAVFIRFNLLYGQVSFSLTRGIFIYLLLFYSIFIVFLYYLFGLYNIFRLKNIFNGTLKVLLINAVGVAGFLSTLFIFRVMDFSRLTILLFWLFSCIFILTKRLIFYVILNIYSTKKHNKMKVVIVGSGHSAHQFAQDVYTNPYLRFHISGYIGDIKQDNLGKYLGTYEQINDIFASHKFDTVVIALEHNEIDFMPKILKIVDKEGLRVEMIPFYNDYFPAKPSITALGKSKLIDLRAIPLDNIGGAIVKRFLDIILSLLLITLTSPIMLFTTLGIKMSNTGPIFFRQERIGKNKVPFTMLKFRSMRANTSTTGWTTHKDGRKTKFGSFIRKCSIDELPQLFNCLSGSMSLVGPRPEMPFYVKKFKEDIPFYLLRQQVKPGMTGWAQIHGLRGDTSIEKRVEYDLWYIENWSIALDIKILLKTLFGGFINDEIIITDSKTNKTKSKV